MAYRNGLAREKQLDAITPISEASYTTQSDGIVGFTG